MKKITCILIVALVSALLCTCAYASDSVTGSLDCEETQGEISRLMPITITRYGSATITNFYGRADMSVQANVVSDAQSGRIMYVNYIDAYQYGAFLNFPNWTTTSISKVLNYPSEGYLYVTVSGRATWAYSDPVTGITTGQTANTTFYVTIDCR